MAIHHSFAQITEIAQEIGRIKGERDEARAQVKELTERLANCRCSTVVIAVDPSPMGTDIIVGHRWSDGPR